MLNLLEVAKAYLAQSYVFTHEDCPFSVTVHDGHPRVLVVGGPNASGKSFFVEMLRAAAHRQHVPNIQVSIRERCGGGTFENSGFRRAMMFGEENEQSTGATSVGVVETAFRNMPSRLENDSKALLVLDEPELGLSDGYAHAMGEFLAAQIAELPENGAVAIVTHSRALVRNLAKHLGTAPSFVSMGSPQPTLEEWLNTSEQRTLTELMELQKLGNERRRMLSKLAREMKKSA